MKNVTESKGIQIMKITQKIIYNYYIKPETHKGLKRVTLICLFCPMLVIIHFEKYHIWNEKKG